MDDDFMMLLSDRNQMNLIRKTNEYATQYGLCLTDYDIQELMIRRRECYQLGYDAVIEKTRKTQDKYKELMKFFDYYGNQNYRDTVEKALPGFFLYYDAKFSPMETIITMDYPVFGLDMKGCSNADHTVQIYKRILTTKEFFNDCLYSLHIQRMVCCLKCCN